MNKKIRAKCHHKTGRISMVKIYLKILLIMLGVCSMLMVNSQELFTGANVNNIENIRGLVKPRNKAVLSSGIPGKILDIRFGVGDRFNEGDLLIQFNCGRYQAELESANARFKAEYKKYENNQKLLALNATSEIDVEVSLAEMEIARAESTIKRIAVNDCLIKAPYTGRVIDVLVNEYETVLADQQLISILNDQVLEIELIIPSNWLIEMNLGEEFNFAVDETGKDYIANITQIGAIVDPVSQTVRIIGEFVNKPEDVLSGMSGTAIFK